jgi:hypothetical protein
MAVTLGEGQEASVSGGRRLNAVKHGETASVGSRPASGEDA